MTLSSLSVSTPTHSLIGLSLSQFWLKIQLGPSVAL